MSAECCRLKQLGNNEGQTWLIKNSWITFSNWQRVTQWERVNRLKCPATANKRPPMFITSVIFSVIFVFFHILSYSNRHSRWGYICERDTILSCASHFNCTNKWQNFFASSMTWLVWWVCSTIQLPFLPTPVCGITTTSKYTATTATTTHYLLFTMQWQPSSSLYSSISVYCFYLP